MQNKQWQKKQRFLNWKFQLSFFTVFIFTATLISLSLAQEAPVPPAPTPDTENTKPRENRFKKVWQKVKNKVHDEFSNDSLNNNSSNTEQSTTRQKPLPMPNDALKQNNLNSAKTPVKKLVVKPVYKLSLSPDGYQLAMPGYQFKFPKDHASHPNYKTEWWYYTGHLKDDSGKRYGYELTFFRSGIPLKNPPTQSLWKLKDVYAAHFAVTDLDKHRFAVAERLNRNSPYPGSGLAQADRNRFYVLNDTWGTWQIKQKPDALTLENEPAKSKLVTPSNTKLKLPPSFWLQADMNAGDVQNGNAWEGFFSPSNRYKLALTLTPLKPPTIHGSNGSSQKGSCQGCASHYYSMTRLRSEGTLWINGKPKHVHGISWMDREFGSNQLTKEQTGWDWFSIQLDNHQDVMLYVLRNEKKVNGKIVQYIDPNSSGTLVYPNGQSIHLKRGMFKIKALGQWTSPTSGGKYPMGWQIDIPAYRLHLTLKPEMENQELVTHQSTKVIYWEGSSRVTGKVGSKKVTGLAYVEMTGYAKKFRQRI